MTRNLLQGEARRRVMQCQPSSWDTIKRALCLIDGADNTKHTIMHDIYRPQGADEQFVDFVLRLATASTRLEREFGESTSEAARIAHILGGLRDPTVARAVRFETFRSVEDLLLCAYAALAPFGTTPRSLAHLR